jgi:hypothetical protein
MIGGEERSILMPEAMIYLTLKRASHQLGVHEQTLRSWEKRGLIQMVRLPGSGYRRVLVTEVERLQDKMLRAGDVPRVRLDPPRRDAEALAQAAMLAEAVRAELVGLEATTLDDLMAARRGRSWSP